VFGTSPTEVWLHDRQRLLDAVDGPVGAASSGDDAIIVWVQNHIFDPLFVPSLLEQRRIQSADALARADRIGDPFMLFCSASQATAAAGAAGDIDDADRCLEIMQSVADQLNQPMVDWTLTFMRAGRALIAGDTDEGNSWPHKHSGSAPLAGTHPTLIRGQFIAWPQHGTLGMCTHQTVAVGLRITGLRYRHAQRRRHWKQFSAADSLPRLHLDHRWSVRRRRNRLSRPKSGPAVRPARPVCATVVLQAANQGPISAISAVSPPSYYTGNDRASPSRAQPAWVPSSTLPGRISRRATCSPSSQR
jgi:hypothetical protein